MCGRHAEQSTFAFRFASLMKSQTLTASFIDIQWKPDEYKLSATTLCELCSEFLIKFSMMHSWYRVTMATIEVGRCCHCWWCCNRTTNAAKPKMYYFRWWFFSIHNVYATTIVARLMLLIIVRRTPCYVHNTHTMNSMRRQQKHEFTINFALLL